MFVFVAFMSYAMRLLQRFAATLPQLAAPPLMFAAAMPDAYDIACRH